jgi:hypothetical protein
MFLLLQEHEVLIAQSNQILTAIIHGMRQNEPSNHVRLAATTALLNSLEFTRANFDKEVCIYDSFSVIGFWFAFYMVLCTKCIKLIHHV